MLGAVSMCVRCGGGKRKVFSLAREAFITTRYKFSSCGPVRKVREERGGGFVSLGVSRVSRLGWALRSSRVRGGLDRLSRTTSGHDRGTFAHKKTSCVYHITILNATDGCCAHPARTP